MTPSFRAPQVADTPRLQQADTRDRKLVGQFRYQCRISTNSGAVTAVGEAIPVVQDAFATFDLLGSLRVVDHVRASVNLRNVTNAKYRGTLKYRQAFSLPRAASWRRCASIIDRGIFLPCKGRGTMRSMVEGCPR